MAKHLLIIPRKPRMRWTRRRTIGTALATLAALVGLTACSQKAQEPFRDAPVAKHINNPVTIVEMADGFSNVATVCATKGIRVAVVYHGDSLYGSVAMIIDPNCP